MEKIQKILILLLIGVFAKTEAQFIDCDPEIVSWHAHPLDCTLYIICFHGNEHIMRCAPTLHYSPSTTECMLPEDAGCASDSRCPPLDDPSNPVFLPNDFDCGRYYICVNGIPNPRNCTEGLWWDVENNWCTFPDQVTCENGTVITPPPPTTTTLPTTTTTQITTTTPGGGTPPIGLGNCTRNIDLFNGPEYLRTMCIVETSATYENARIRCEAMGMNLFVVDTEPIYILFHREIMANVGNRHPSGAVFINGRFNHTIVNEWTTQNADDTFLGLVFDGLNWVNTGTVNGRTSGPCLSYSGQHSPGDYQGLGIACNTGRWFVCEHGFATTTPDPTNPTVVSTTPGLITTTTAASGGPDLSQCSQREDLFDNGVYMKSFCIVASAVNYATAEQRCRNSGMELFVLDSSPLQREFKSSVTRLLVGNPRGHLWINGRFEDDGCREWYNYDPNRRLMWDGVHWVQTDNIIGRLNGECLRFSAEHSVGEPNWQGVGSNCAGGSWFVCEYST